MNRRGFFAALFGSIAGAKASEAQLLRHGAPFGEYFSIISGSKINLASDWKLSPSTIIRDCDIVTNGHSIEMSDYCAILSSRIVVPEDATLAILVPTSTIQPKIDHCLFSWAQ